MTGAPVHSMGVLCHTSGGCMATVTVWRAVLVCTGLGLEPMNPTPEGTFGPVSPRAGGPPSCAHHCAPCTGTMGIGHPSLALGANGHARPCVWWVDLFSSLGMPFPKSKENQNA
jgi:hypothetical protein